MTCTNQYRLVLTTEPTSAVDGSIALGCPVAAADGTPHFEPLGWPRLAVLRPTLREHALLLLKKKGDSKIRQVSGVTQPEADTP